MIREEVIIEEIEVNWSNRFYSFQINLPQDTVRIIGVEVSIMDIDSDFPDFPMPGAFSPFIVNWQMIAGELTLMGMGSENVFYSADVVGCDYNGNFGHVVGDVLPGSPFTHQTKARETGLDLPVTTSVIEGRYQDRFLISTESDHMNYNLRIYIWIEKRIKDELPTGA